ncbi:MULTISPECIES: XdhC family protein [Agrobacterium]|uniref:XdhC family protein n=1 Tax=Agrobacterium TaxID=357 RepID=UPI001FE0372E|nr:XdhC family protein [Agrobacterium sp. RS6]
MDPGRTEELTQLIGPSTTAAVLDDDIDAEMPLLAMDLRSKAFYAGALGSTRTNRKRCDRLASEGFAASEIARIKAPMIRLERFCWRLVDRAGWQQVYTNRLLNLTAFRWCGDRR